MENKKFLDYNGLATLWGYITDLVKTKISELSNTKTGSSDYIDITISEEGGLINNININDNRIDEKINSEVSNIENALENINSNIDNLYTDIIDDHIHTYELPGGVISIVNEEEHSHNYEFESITASTVEDHDHTYILPTGIESIFIGDQLDSEVIGEHYHAYTPSGAVILSGTVSEDGVLTISAEFNGNENDTLSAGDHYHKYTPSGTVTSAITESEITYTSPSGEHTHNYDRLSNINNAKTNITVSSEFDQNVEHSTTANGSHSHDISYTQNDNSNITKIIKFYVDNVEHEAEHGMLWDQFINSDYNPDADINIWPGRKLFTITEFGGESYVSCLTGIGELYVQKDGVDLKTTEMIISNKYYTINRPNIKD